MDTTSEWVAAAVLETPMARADRCASWPGMTPAGSRLGERQVASGTTAKSVPPTVSLPAKRSARAAR
eukprot:14258393-Alexandrium_andersonii.AAC.1